MLCVVVYRPYSDPHSRVRDSNRASHIPRVRGYRRGYAMATLHAYSSDPRALLVLADFASAAPKTAAVRLRSTGAPHRSKGAFHTYRCAFPLPACGKDRRRSRAVGDSAVSPPPSPGAALARLLGSCESYRVQKRVCAGDLPPPRALPSPSTRGSGSESRPTRARPPRAPARRPHSSSPTGMVPTATLARTCGGLRVSRPWDTWGSAK